MALRTFEGDSQTNVTDDSISEPYLPDRCLRQLGHVQSIPREPIQPNGKTRRPFLASSYRVTYGSNVTQMEQWEDVVLSLKTRGP
ncbi:hypothetical protein QJS10_CPA16g01483 [Acorus calamus]|uniref:Uncharacterized protein n=1 Tax=Acorus calamus TaxID=4465 RepID=A0AAV9D1E1_ACOCL|nr:hypothetical protein QJS10_CPA16g01483 [Acorus calamus]